MADHHCNGMKPMEPVDGFGATRSASRAMCIRQIVRNCAWGRTGGYLLAVILVATIHRDYRPILIFASDRSSETTSYYSESLKLLRNPRSPTIDINLSQIACVALQQGEEHGRRNSLQDRD
ncbi:hypothetical protein E5S70_07145 [Ensifer adhaerens]|uniref:hypothetical protein n=1 Tax=Ensifer canadensis TaxID=555315 RepID=UPI00148F74E5|nr:hypothetical protein [Ensifer canadensis]NOV15863.1 hypothetical protein [Ensifer canadensis]